MREDQVRQWTARVFQDGTTRLLRRRGHARRGARALFDHRVLRFGKEMHVFSHTLDKMTASDQAATGRCWGFAGLSLLRRALAKERDLCPDFELSQAHLMFYDKLEKAHAFLRRMQTTPLDERRRIHLCDAPIHDGGNWHTFVALVGKYGVVPASAMPETDPSMYTKFMNAFLRTLLLQTAAGDLSEDAVEDTLRRAHRLLCICMGTPPATFTWTYRDSNEAATPRRSGRRRTATPRARSTWTTLSCSRTCPIRLTRRWARRTPSSTPTPSSGRPRASFTMSTWTNS